MYTLDIYVCLYLTYVCSIRYVCLPRFDQHSSCTAYEKYRHAYVSMDIRTYMCIHVYIYFIHVYVYIHI